VVSTFDGKTKLYSAQTGEFLGEIGETPAKAQLYSLAFSPDSHRLLLGYRDHSNEEASNRGNVAHLWDINDGKLISALEGHSEGIISLAFSPDGRQILTGSYDNSARLWEAETSKSLAYFEDSSDRESVNFVAFSPEAKKALISTSYKANLWELANSSPYPVPSSHIGYISTIALTREADLLVTGSWDKTLLIWSKNREKLGVYRQHGDSVSCAVISPDNITVASGSMDGAIHLWETATRQTIAIIDTGRAVRSLGYSLDGAKLAGGCEDGRVHLYDIEQNKVISR
jgi:WD40 repeat protein